MIGRVENALVHTHVYPSSRSALENWKRDNARIEINSILLTISIGSYVVLASTEYVLAVSIIARQFLPSTYFVVMPQAWRYNNPRNFISHGGLIMGIIHAYRELLLFVSQTSRSWLIPLF